MFSYTDVARRNAAFEWRQMHQLEARLNRVTDYVYTNLDGCQRTAHATMPAANLKLAPTGSLWLFTVLVACAHAADGPATVATGLQSDVRFTEYSPLSRSDELIRRFLTPLNADDLTQRATRARMVFDQQAIDLSKERFALFVPSQPPPPQGYALMVFVPPWEQATVPPDWVPVLERHGMIFVTAASSGNAADILERRGPLALLGAYNATKRYPVDPARSYIGGMSGGSRVALRIALSYPDLFRGVFLNSGSDPIGNQEAPIPSAELFTRFQDATRLVFFTGQTDIANLYQDDDSRQSLRHWCVFDLYDETIPFAGHELASGRDFEHVVTALEKHVAPNPNALARCRKRYVMELESGLTDVQKSISRGDLRAAATLLEKIDTHFAGLAAPESIALAKQIDGHPQLPLQVTP
jgi:Esterase PHB depolymerase